VSQQQQQQHHVSTSTSCINSNINININNTKGSSCDSTATEGCSSGYGDVFVGLQTFVEAYMEDIMLKGNDDFDYGVFARCTEYNPDEDVVDDANNNNNNSNTFYVGPTCSDDGLDIKLELFTDEY
jgi:hypothetical protein